MIKKTHLCLSTSGFHHMAYRQWGDADNPHVLICVHGLTRNGRDFDTLAQALADRYRVLCPDVAGRGDSDWLQEPNEYAYPRYCADLTSLIAACGATEVDWLGTSMGGLIGLLLAAHDQTPIRRLILNDVGPFLPKAALQRIAAYVGLDPRFKSRRDLESHLKQIYSPFGPFTESQWQSLVDSSLRETREGDIALNYDPAISVPIQSMPMDDVDLWPVWDRLQCPVLLIRGAQSDVLPAATADEMARRHASLTRVDYPNIGHAPTLMADAQIRLISDWLAAP